MCQASTSASGPSGGDPHRLGLDKLPPGVLDCSPPQLRSQRGHHALHCHWSPNPYSHPRHVRAAQPRPEVPGVKLKLLTGQRFGRLDVLERLPSTKYRCLCDCGRETAVIRGNLMQGITKSCGCLQKEVIRRTRTKINSRELAIARYYRRNAKVRGLVWGLTQCRLEDFLHDSCIYCGTAPALGVDRLDNSQGYVLGNCASCCVTCNRAKLTMSVSEFKAWIAKVARHMDLL